MGIQGLEKGELILHTNWCSSEIAYARSKIQPTDSQLNTPGTLGIYRALVHLDGQNSKLKLCLRADWLA
jgi:hypothetical protein